MQKKVIKAASNCLNAKLYDSNVFSVNLVDGIRVFWARGQGRETSQKSFQDEIEHSEQKDDNGYLIDAVHHSYVDVRRAGWILFPKEVAADLAE